jgi:hypothetical protein
MAAEQHEHRATLSSEGAASAVLPGGMEDADALSGDVDEIGFQDVLDCFRGFDVPVRRDFAQVLARTPAGPELAGLLDAIDLDVLDAHDRVEVVAAAARVESWAHAVKAGAAVSVDRHWRMTTPLPEGFPRGGVLVPERIAAATLALRLQASARETGLLITEGRCYDGVLAPTGAALAAGEIDVPRARAIVRRLHDQPGQVAWLVQEEVLEVAEGRTSHQVAQDVERALRRVDPEHAAERHQAARDTRTVSHPMVRPDGMAGLWVLLPAETAVRVDTVLESAARTARSAGDPRTLTQLRADGLCDLILRTTSCTPDETSTDDRDHPAAGYPGADQHPPLRVPASHPRTRVLVTIPITTLIGLDDLPADLDGYGPVDAVQARALAWGGTWQRMLTDPRDNTLLDLGRTRYRPTAALADHVRRRDRTCAWPGCPISAERTDLDHVRDFHQTPSDGGPPGVTADTNLDPLCRNHHRLKTYARFRLRMRTPGLHEWTDPTGHRYEVRPGTDRPIRRLPAVEPPPPF